MSTNSVAMEIHPTVDLLTNKPVAPIHPLISVIDEKFEKHKKKAEPILSDMITPYEAFKNGCEEAIASFIKLGQEGQKTQKIAEGPLVINTHTKVVQALVDRLLTSFDSVKFVKKGDMFYVLSQGKQYNLASLLSQVNFNQIRLTPKQLNNYHALIGTDKIIAKPYLPSCTGRPTDTDFNARDKEGLCKALSLPEKEAINIYTGSSYLPMNAFMRGQIQEAIDQLPNDHLLESRKVNTALKEIILHVAVAVSALNKLPDYVSPAGPDGKVSKYLFRGEGSIPDTVLAKRKWAVQQGGKVTVELGFLSTSYAKPAEAFFGENTQVGILFKNLKGKKITPLSQYGSSEREVLLPPTQIQWQYHKEIITDIYKNTMHLFIAKPVTAPYEKPTVEDAVAKEAWLAKQQAKLEGLGALAMS